MRNIRQSHDSAGSWRLLEILRSLRRVSNIKIVPSNTQGVENLSILRISYDKKPEYVRLASSE